MKKTRDDFEAQKIGFENILNKINILSIICNYNIKRKDNSSFLLEKGNKNLSVKINEDLTVSIKSENDVYRDINKKFLPEFITDLFFGIDGCLDRSTLNKRVIELDNLDVLESPDFAYYSIRDIIKLYEGFQYNANSEKIVKIPGNRSEIIYYKGHIVMIDEIRNKASNVIKCELPLMLKLLEKFKSRLKET